MNNSSLTDFLLQTLSKDDTAAALSRRLGTDESQTKSALEVAVPLLMGALGKNAQEEAGAEKLDGALRRDHDGSILQNVGDYLSKEENRKEGEAILKHVLGGKTNKAEKGVAQTTGIEQSQAGALLAILAPLVLGALGKEQDKKGLDAGGVAGVLQKERQQTEQSKSPIAALITDIIDSNDDGNILDDIMGMAMRFFGGNRTS